MCSDGEVSGGQGTCDEGQVCLFYGQNPVENTANFDTILWAWMTIFQCVTLEGWVDVMYMTMTTQV